MNDMGHGRDERSTTVAAEVVPRLVPVRMLNEFVYCPRLFYLEWVSGQFADNDFTVDGRWQHRAVDRERGAAPAAGDELPFKEATSVTLSSERLGLIGQADVIQGDGDGVVPVDVKRGSPAVVCGAGVATRTGPTGGRWVAPERQRLSVRPRRDLLRRDQGTRVGRVR